VRDLLGGQQFELLVPILVMHQEAYREYREERLYLLARHSADMAAELADFYAKRSADPAAAMLASDVLTSLAGYLQDGWSLSSSAGLFTRALELDPGNEVAHLGLAALFEKRGEYEEATQHLRRALAGGRDSADTRLRLALCLLRGTGAAEAEAMLAKLAATAEADWVGVLAVQELAMLYARRGELEAAEQLLQAGRERFPDNHRLAIQMIWVREKLGRPTSSALAELDVVDRTGRTDRAPRYVYTLWPSDWLAELRLGLRSTADDRNVILAAALAAAPAVESAS
jgi:tetratricopeptide (TPR) repeat protein